MASNANALLDSEISKVTDIVSANNRLRFAVEFLGIDGNEYRTIEADAKFIHHDTLYECIKRWRNRTEAEGNNAKDELIRILNEIRRQHGWFPGNAVTFLTDVTGLQIPQDRLEKIQDWTKQSLQRRLHKSLSHDWIHEKTSHKFPLRQYYVQLEWEKKMRTAMGSRTVTLTSVHDLIKQLTMPKAAEGTVHTRQKAMSVMIEGEGGIGKTSSLGIIALDWAEDARPELKQFQFVFLILLRHVEGNEPLEHIIMQQHGLLETMNISPSEVKAILHGETNGNILLIFDGYDEYTEGCNEDIDKILLNGRENCLILLSSRSGDFLEQIKSQINEEVKITGFSYDNIQKCGEQYLNSKDTCQEFLKQAERASIHQCKEPRENDMKYYKGFLHVPIILLMACTVFIENHCLPSSKLGLFKQVVQMCISRTTLKTMGKTASEVENLYEMMVKLGKVAWNALNRKSKQLLIYKKDVIAESEDILKLGLLFGEDTNATTEELPAVLSFQHKLLQEYPAAVYIADQAKLDTAETFLTEALPTWEAIENHREVVQFTCGILVNNDASPIANHVAKKLAQHLHNELNDGKALPDLSILQSCQKEGGLSAYLNPYLSNYPTCGHPLAEVLANTELAYITDIDGNDPLDLTPSTAQIIVKLGGVDSERLDKLWQAFYSAHANIIALHLDFASSRNVTKLHHFPQLKYLYLHLSGRSEEAMEDLAESINSWGPQPQLTYCKLRRVPIPRSVMTALCKCTHLKHLHLEYCTLHGKLSVFMADPPHALGELILGVCSLHGSDVDHLTQSIRQGNLTSLLMLDIQFNPVGEVAVGHLLEALISTRPHTQLTLRLYVTGVDENGKRTDLPEQFMTEWKTKLTDKNVNVQWTGIKSN